MFQKENYSSYAYSQKTADLHMCEVDGKLTGCMDILFFGSLRQSLKTIEQKQQSLSNLFCVEANLLNSAVTHLCSTFSSKFS